MFEDLAKLDRSLASLLSIYIIYYLFSFCFLRTIAYVLEGPLVTNITI